MAVSEEGGPALAASTEISAEGLRRRALAVAEQSLADIATFLPYLSELVGVAQLIVTERVPTAAIAATGRIFVNPEWFGALERREALYVMAHELWHLVLRTHERASGQDAELFNIAHDLVINDILSDDLGMAPPAGGLSYAGASEKSGEELVRWLKQTQPHWMFGLQGSWRVDRGAAPRGGQGGAREISGALGDALVRAGLAEAPAAPGAAGGERLEQIRSELIDEARERELMEGALMSQAELSALPQLTPEALRELKAAAAAAAQKALEHAALLDAAKSRDRAGGEGPRARSMMAAVRAAYQPALELALQRGLDSILPSGRTYARASRRQGARSDVVLAGRERIGWRLNIILDTSGSMVDDVPPILGIIARFGAESGVSDMRLVQVSNAVTGDDLIDPNDIESFEIKGFGGSDLRPAFERLAREPDVEAVAVITDGFIDHPEAPPPYQVVWLITHSDWDDEDFDPGYGAVIKLPPHRA